MSGFVRSMSICLKRAFRRVILASTVVVSLQACTTARAELYELDLHLHALAGDASDMFDAAANPVSEAPPGGALLPVMSAAKDARPGDDSKWSFTGTASNEPLWVLPKNNLGGRLYLGIGTEEISATDLAGSVTMRFVSLSGPAGGVFSVWNSGSSALTWANDPIPLITSTTGFGLPNALTIDANDHAHFNYGFTAPGLYNVTFEATATLADSFGGGTVRGIGTFKFGVFDNDAPYIFPAEGPYTFFEQNFDNAILGNGHMDLGIALKAVPEPSSVALAGLGVAGLVGAELRRRMRRQRKLASVAPQA